MRISVCLVLVSLLLFSAQQEDPIQKVIAALKRYQVELPQEKIYVQLDKPYYTSGEKIWLKAYLTAGPDHVPSQISQVVYVDLVDDQKKIIEHLKILVKNSSGSSAFSIPDTLSTGNYAIRAYTNWMRNFDEAYHFHQLVKIWNLKSPEQTVGVTRKMDLQFFPEAGTFITGLRTRIGFKAVGSDGRGMKIKGTIIDEGGKQVTDFQSNFLGMGSFFITPQKGKTYRALVEGLAGESPLPTAMDEGVALAVTQNLTNGTVVVKLQTTRPGKSISLLGQTRGEVAYASKVTLPNTINYVNIPKTNFLHGTAQISIFNEFGLPIGERLIFVERDSLPSVTIKTNKTSFAPREKVVLEIEAKDKNGQPISADLSVAVCDGDQVLVDPNQETIKSYLYFSSEIRGIIESPGYYFNLENNDRLVALDHLLLTQGYRRFDYQMIAKNEWKEAVHAPESGISIKGTLVDKYNQKPIADGKVTYFSNYPSLITINTRSDEFGYFEINNIVHFDSTRAVLQGETKKGSKLVEALFNAQQSAPRLNYDLPLLSGSIDEFERNFIKAGAERKQIDQSFDFDGKTIVMEGIEIRGKKDEEFRRETTKIYGRGTATVKVSESEELQNLFHPLQLIQGRVAGVQVINDGPSSWNVIIRGTNSLESGTLPLILLNNLPVDIGTLNMLSVRDVESVEVWKGADAAIFGSRGSNGVVAFYTKTGDFNPVYKSNGVDQIKIDGLEMTKIFYAPKYDVALPEHIKPDRRVTLHWAPEVRTNEAGKATLSFYNHDLETTIVGKVEGLSISGKPLVGNFQYTIKK